MSHNDQLKIPAFMFLELIPSDLAQEIVLTGSVARNMSDTYSDIEFDLWNEDMPSRAAREGWLTSVGATDIHIRPEPESDGSEVIEFRFDSFEYELTWQTYKNFRKIIDAKNSGDIDSDTHTLAWSCYFMQVVKDKKAVKPLIEEMLTYPADLSEKIIFSALDSWYGSVQARASSVTRNERYYSYTTLQKDIQKLIRILYALNRRWEAYPKWLHHDLHALTVLPLDFIPTFENLFDSIHDLKKAWSTYSILLKSVFVLLEGIHDPTIQKEISRITSQLDVLQVKLHGSQN